MEKTHHKYSLIVYLLLANGITWLCWIPGLLIGGQLGYIMPNFTTYAELAETGFANSQHLWLGIAFSLGVFGPLIGGLVATWMDGGREGLSRLWARIAKWRVGDRWYLNALAVALALTVLPVVVLGFGVGFTAGSYTIGYVLLVFLVQLFTSGLGEEPGWRGFLLPRLQEKPEGEKYIWVLGLIWAIWHYPLVIFQTLGAAEGIAVPQLVVMTMLALAGQTMSLIGITYLYVWFYNHTQSLFLAIVFHALSNVLSNWSMSFLENPQAVTIIIALMPWAVVIFLQKRLGKEQFPGPVPG